MPLRLCLGWNREICTRLVADGNRCPAHHRAAEAWRNRNRPGSRDRGYDAEYEANRAYVLSLSHTCWMCGHDGADQADHVVPRSRGGTNAVTNLRPVHGTQPCRRCHVRCNQSRSNRV